MMSMTLCNFKTEYTKKQSYLKSNKDSLHKWRMANLLILCLERWPSYKPFYAAIASNALCSVICVTWQNYMFSHSINAIV